MTSGSAEAPRPRSPRTARIATVVAYALLFVPLVTVAALSVMVPDDAGGHRFGFDLYARLIDNPVIGEALWRSVRIAAVVSIVSSVIGGFGALALERERFPGRELLAAATFLPLVMPELVLGLASLIWFSVLRMSLGVVSIVLAHVTFTVSYVVVTVRARLRDFDRSLEEAAADLGAPPVTVFRRVTLPLLAPGVAAGAMMAFTLSFDDFLLSFFTAGVASDTLPMKLYGMIRFGLDREMYALSVLLILATVLGLGLQARLSHPAR